MGNILRHGNQPFEFRLDRSDCWDFHLSLDPYCSFTEGLRTDCLYSFIDTDDPDCIWFDSLISKKDFVWDACYNNGLELDNIGMTGVDNGFIKYEKDRITNEKFLELFLKSKYKIDSGDCRFYLRKVDGNNQIFDYTNELVHEDGVYCSKLNGGFYQGFFQTDKYRVLPKNLNKSFVMDVVLKKAEFDENNGMKLNDRYPNNKGFFLYIGTRAENKWWQNFVVDDKFDESFNGYVVDGYTKDEYTDTNHLNDQYIKPFEDLYVSLEYLNDGYQLDKCEEKAECCCGSPKNKTLSSKPYYSGMPVFTYPEALNVYEDNAVWFTEDGHLWVENELETTRWRGGDWPVPKKRCKKCSEVHYFSDEYITSDYYENMCDCSIYFKDDYLKQDVEIDVDEDIVTSDGYSVKQPNIRQYRTDNKFILFDRTCNGVTVDTYDEDMEVVIDEIMTPKMKNYFELFNRTCNGYTVNTIDPLIKYESKRYDVLADIYRNALGFRIDDDGRVGYRYIVKGCENGGYKTEEEYSNEGAVKNNKWSTVTVKIDSLGRGYGECTEKVNVNDKMTVTIYVDGKLKLVSKELPLLNLRKLNDLYSKQEGVPFSISVGGGTQGLCDTIGLNYRELPKYALPLEKEFGGSFIGFVRKFRFYGCDVSFSDIVKNAVFDGTF